MSRRILAAVVIAALLSGCNTVRHPDEKLCFSKNMETWYIALPGDWILLGALHVPGCRQRANREALEAATQNPKDAP